MKMLPRSQSSLLVRTDFSDEEAWKAFETAIATPNEQGFLAYAVTIDDPAYQDLTAEQVRDLVPANHRHRLLAVVDRVTLTSPEMPILVIDLFEPPPGRIRVIAAEFWSIENNLSQANLDFASYVRRAGEDGVFRGF